MSFLFTIAEMLFIPLLIVLIPVIVGQWYGLYQKKKQIELPPAPVGSAVGAAFGLLAFLLAFTFQIASSRFDKRNGLLLDETTDIRTTYLRAGLLPETFRLSTRRLLVEYVDLRVYSFNDPEKVELGVARSQEILDTLWKYAESLAQLDKPLAIHSLYISSVNDLVREFNLRISMTAEYRIPSQIFWIFLIIMFLSMLILGYQFGISGRRNIGINVMIALIFAVAIFLILMLDRPSSGLIKLNQKPILKLQKQLREMQLKSYP